MSDTLPRFSVAPWRWRIAAMTSALALAAPAPALAQQVFDLDEITVTANRVPTEIQRSGASVTIVNRDELEADGEARLSEVLNRLPGVSVTQSGGFGTTAQLAIRGAGPRYIAVYVDGVRVDDPTGITNETDFGAFVVDDIERLEVLRGTQSALYGGSAVGGVISITSRRPQRDGFSQEAAVEAGSNRTFGGRYTLAFRDERLEAAVTLAHRRSDGFSAWEGLMPVPGNLAPDGFEMTRLSANFRYQASEAFAFGFSAFGQRTRADYDGYGDAFADNELRRRQTGGRVFAEYDTGAVRHELSLTRYDIKRRFFEGGADAGWYAGDRTGLAYQGTAEVNDGLTLVWGADTTQDRGEFEASLTGRERMRTTGAFGQVLWSPMVGLDVSASARVDRSGDFGTFTSGRISAAWQATDGVTLRGALARGFTAPSINQRFGANYGFTMVAPNPGLQPETSRSAELGADWSQGGVTMGATVFRIDTDNAIEWCGDWADPCGFALPPGFTNAYQNIAGVTRRQGIELAASAELNDRLTLGANYTYTHTRTPSGTQLTMIPRHVLNLSLDAILTDRLSGTLSARHVAGRANQQDWLAGVSREMPAYTVVNTSLRYAVNDQADVIVRVDNLFNRQYQQVWGYGTPNRSYYLGVAARF
ncbi:MAG: TonB-dependent receptor [Pararhodobacter sp.]|nr:TonB-dependent receptor [Pararhodobacter sp.]